MTNNETKTGDRIVMLRSEQPIRKLCWMSDLHLDATNDFSQWCFLEKLRVAEFDAAVVTGDVSIANDLEEHLRAVAQACAPRPVYFVAGNHDFFGSSFAAVDAVLEGLCADLDNLVCLGHGEIVLLGNNAALVGHRGWADGLSGRQQNTGVESSDHERIQDFREIPDRRHRFAKMAALGAESANYFRSVLPRCLGWTSHVFIATHFPPFVQATRYGDRQCDRDHLPHFCNLSAGQVLGWFAKRTQRKMTVLCGHTHCPAEVQFANTLTIRVAGAVRGEPTFELLQCA